MRNAYTAQLDELNADLCRLAEAAGDAMVDASASLLEHDVHRAEAAIARSDFIAGLGRSCEDRAVAVLALQSPVAADLRRVFSAVRISSDLARMGGLAIHIAEAARRRFPDVVIPEHLVEPFKHMTELCLEMATRVHVALQTSELDGIEDLQAVDDRVDEIHARIITAIADDDPATDITAAVDIALLCRYCERFADQSVDVAKRIVFLVSGRR